MMCAQLVIVAKLDELHPAYCPVAILSESIRNVCVGSHRDPYIILKKGERKPAVFATPPKGGYPHFGVQKGVFLGVLKTQFYTFYSII